MLMDAPPPDAVGETETASPQAISDAAFVRCIERLEEMIDAETRILKSCARVDFEALNLRKTHALLEFTRVAKNSPPHATEAASRNLSRLRQRLAANTEALEQHLLAMQEIANLVVACIRNDDSDGTYSRKGAPRR